MAHKGLLAPDHVLGHTRNIRSGQWAKTAANAGWVALRRHENVQSPDKVCDLDLAIHFHIRLKYVKEVLGDFGVILLVQGLAADSRHIPREGGCLAPVLQESSNVGSGVREAEG